MYLVLIHYLRPVEEVARLRPVHRAFLARHYAAGHLLCSGPRRDGAGGVVLARGPGKAELEAIFAGDPYARAGLATHEVVEFDVISRSPDFDPLLAPGPAD